MIKKYFAFFLLLLIIACNNQKSSREMSALEVMGQINNDFCLLIDIREKGSFSQMADPAIWIPYTDIDKNQSNLTSILPANIQNKTLVLYSENTDLSIKACQILIKANYKCNYLKNFSDWEQNNLLTKKIKP